MITIEEVNNAKNKIQVLELELENARKTANLIETKYIEENAKFKFGDVCSVENTDFDGLVCVSFPILLCNEISYMCTDEITNNTNYPLRLVYEEKNLTFKYNKFDK